MTVKFPKSRILIIDRDQDSSQAMAQLLGVLEVEKVSIVAEPECAFSAFLEFDPDLVIIGVEAWDKAGFELVNEFAEVIHRRVFVPVLVITDDGSPRAKELALENGALDLVSRPFSETEVLHRINNLLFTRRLQLQLEKENGKLELCIRERTRELEEAYGEILERLAVAAEFRDDETGSHAQQVAETTEAIARKLGLPDYDCQLVGRAALLHDVGKIGIPDAILLKPGPLTADEMAIMQTHVEIGAKLLSNSRSKLLKLAEVIALTHHERWNGAGYMGLSGEDIPLPGRIVTVADVFDVLLSRRTYKDAWRLGDAIAEIRRGRGIQFDPAVVDAFIELVEEGFFDHVERERFAFA